MPSQAAVSTVQELFSVTCVQAHHDNPGGARALCGDCTPGGVEAALAQAIDDGMSVLELRSFFDDLSAAEDDDAIQLPKSLRRRLESLRGGLLDVPAPTTGPAQVACPECGTLSTVPPDVSGVICPLCDGRVYTPGKGPGKGPK